MPPVPAPSLLSWFILTSSPTPNLRLTHFDLVVFLEDLLTHLCLFSRSRSHSTNRSGAPSVKAPASSSRHYFPLQLCNKPFKFVSCIQPLFGSIITKPFNTVWRLATHGWQSKVQAAIARQESGLESLTRNMQQFSQQINQLVLSLEPPKLETQPMQTNPPASFPAPDNRCPEPVRQVTESGVQR